MWEGNPRGSCDTGGRWWRGKCTWNEESLPPSLLLCRNSMNAIATSECLPLHTQKEEPPSSSPLLHRNSKNDNAVLKRRQRTFETSRLLPMSQLGKLQLHHRYLLLFVHCDKLSNCLTMEDTATALLNELESFFSPFGGWGGCRNAPMSSSVFVTDWLSVSSPNPI